MVEVAQVVGAPSGIEEKPHPISLRYPYFEAIDREIAKRVPGPSLLDVPPPSCIIIEIGSVLPYDHTARTRMTYIVDNLKKALPWYDKSGWFDKTPSIHDGQTKSLAAMHANGKSLTMTPTPITGTSSSANSREDHDLLLDSGASESVVCKPELLKNRRDPPPGTSQFVGADGSCMAVIGYGDIEMEDFRIPNVYLVQGLIVNLISVGQLASNHKVCCCFAGNECNLMLPDGTRIGGAIRRDDNQYLLRFLKIE